MQSVHTKPGAGGLHCARKVRIRGWAISLSDGKGRKYGSGKYCSIYRDHLTRHHPRRPSSSSSNNHAAHHDILSPAVVSALAQPSLSGQERSSSSSATVVITPCPHVVLCQTDNGSTVVPRGGEICVLSLVVVYAVFTRRDKTRRQWQGRIIFTSPSSFDAARRPSLRPGTATRSAGSRTSIQGCSLQSRRASAQPSCTTARLYAAKRT